MASNYRKGETYDQFMVRQKAEAAGKQVPAPKEYSKPLVGDPVSHMHVSDAVKEILGR